MNRREFLAATSAAAASPATSQFVKSICAIIFPQGMPYAECFTQAKSAGFDGIEIQLGREITLDSTPDQVKQIGDAARKAGITIASMWVSRPFDENPLNSADPNVRARGVEALRKAIQFAPLLGCGALLIVPGRLGRGPKFDFGYEDTWKRVTEEFKKVIPDAAKAKVILTPENVWNKFLVSPLEM